MSDCVTGGLTVLLAAAVIGIALRSYFTKPKLPHGVQFPPGPTSLPILGDMVYTKLFGQDNIVINSEEIARDVLENRSQNYSDRPEIATNDLFGVDHTTVFMRYNDRWCLHRKILHQSFRQDVVPDFRFMQVSKTHKLLLNLRLANSRYRDDSGCNTVSIRP
ncbi:hypothetical protein F4604DRAFT_1920406 [Suillus subluteus]|nr:hypothetical protein F4604DRAFT_1920406 [Suillus subluteus]